MINIFNHLQISTPSLSEAEILFYGNGGYFMFMALNLFAIWGLISLISLLLRKLGGEE